MVHLEGLLDLRLSLGLLEVTSSDDVEGWRSAVGKDGGSDGGLVVDDTAMTQ